MKGWKTWWAHDTEHTIDASIGVTLILRNSWFGENDFSGPERGFVSGVGRSILIIGPSSDVYIA